MRLPKRILVFTVLLLTGISCQEDASQSADPQNLSVFARKYLQMMSSPGLSNTAMSDAVVNGSYNRLLSSSGRTTGRTQDSTSTDTVIVASPWMSCASTTTTNNADGSVTTVVDYGEGCEEGIAPFTYFMHGKYAYTNFSNVAESGFVVTESYAYTYLSDNYGGRYYNGTDTVEWLSNWNGSTSGTASRNKSGEDFWGSYTTSHSGESNYNGETQTYTGSSKSSYNHKQSVLEESNSTTRSGENYYHALVLEPLVMRYDCIPWTSIFASGTSLACYYVPIYVSGREFIRYKQDGKEGSFTIYWGNGSCDSRVEIEENGVYYKLDWANIQTLFNQ